MRWIALTIKLALAPNAHGETVWQVSDSFWVWSGGSASWSGNAWFGNGWDTFPGVNPPWNPVAPMPCAPAPQIVIELPDPVDGVALIGPPVVRNEAWWSPLARRAVRDTYAFASVAKRDILSITMGACPECGNTSGNKVNRRTGVRRCGECDFRWGELGAGSEMVLSASSVVVQHYSPRSFVPTIWADQGSLGFALGQLGSPGAIVAERLMRAMIDECDSAGVLKSPEKVRQCFDRIWRSDDPRLQRAVTMSGSRQLHPAEAEVVVSVAVSGVLLASERARKDQFFGIAKVVGAGLLGGLLGGLIG